MTDELCPNCDHPESRHDWGCWTDKHGNEADRRELVLPGVTEADFCGCEWQPS